MGDKCSEVLRPCVELPLPDNVLLDVIPKAKDYALMHGACMRSKTNFSVDTLQFAPFILTPSSLPRGEYEKSLRLQPLLNKLMHRVAHDNAFLRKTLLETIKVDEFTGNLFKIYDKVHKDDKKQHISLATLRSDVMLDQREGSAELMWKQVEINTISSGFGHLGPISMTLQRYILSELGHYDKLKDLPENNALSEIAGGIIEAWKIADRVEAVVMFLIEEIPFNICDQRFHEFEIRRLNPEVRVIRKTLTQVFNEGSLGANRELIVDGKEVSVVYFRSGYEPGQYPTQNEWDARLMMEQSLAIKCPSIQYHLAGTKKVQQALSKPGALSQFLENEGEIEAVEAIFTGLYSLDFNEEGDKAVEMALANPDRYVLKPQREGGGNNIYGSEIPAALKKMQGLERSAWILMEKISPPVTKAYMIRPGDKVPPPLTDVVSELGIFGVIIGDKDQILYNKQAGQMLRTKIATANEGGVMAGISALDSPYVV